MDTNDLTFVKNALEAIRPTDWDVVAEKSGVPLGTLRKVAYGEVTDPRFWTVKKLADYFRSVSGTQPLVEGRPIDAAVVREAVNGLRKPVTDTRKLRE
ncbi:Hypothetical protein HEAR2300 [Herminiimonas arsenicoxydans]|uniref:HTH cro/C1-type domain-containing protein n=1 Tax=Herminiimonas arsenicoxydans TaxID=204773 RepID=A4G7E4_HERAR|nr:Hypothetical protein HEAR2300 [Herminiimonas arsenicoxydans]